MGDKDFTIEFWIPMDKKVLTRDEEADEIVRRLKTKPSRKARWSLTPDGAAVDAAIEEYIKELAAMVARDIDEECLNIMITNGKTEL